MPIEVNVNGKLHRLDADPAMPLLWVLRDVLHLTGTKYGCGRGLCGACTVHVDGNAVRSCSVTAASVDGASITTIEGLNGPNAAELHPVQAAWIDADVPQCGFCQAGQVMQAASLFGKDKRPTVAEVEASMSGNLCRCGTYQRIRTAIGLAVSRAQGDKE